MKLLKIDNTHTKYNNSFVYHQLLESIKLLAGEDFKEDQVFNYDLDGSTYKVLITEEEITWYEY